MAAITAVHTLAAVALILGVSEELLHDPSIDMEPEYGCVSVNGLGDDDYAPAFTADRIDRLRQLIAECA